MTAKNMAEDLKESCETAENLTNSADSRDDGSNENGEVILANGQEQVATPAAGQQPQEGASMWSLTKGFIIRALIIYFISSYFRRPSQPAGQQDAAAAAGGTRLSSANMFKKDSPLDMYIYINEQAKFDDFTNPEALFWEQKDLIYGDWSDGQSHDGSFVRSGQITATEGMMSNGSIYMHMYFVKAGKSPNPAKKGQYSKRFTFHKTNMLNKYKKKRYQKTHNLLTGVSEATDEEREKAEKGEMDILSHWHPNLTINLVDDHTAWVQGHVPQPLEEYIEFEPVSGNYYPIIYFNDYWNMLGDYQPINHTTPELNLTLTYSPISLFKWQMYAAQSMRNKWTSMLGEGMMEEADDTDQDTLKQAMLETNPYLLGLTVVISIVHSVFEFLAFKNDIQFWNSRKSLEGLSVRSVFFNVFQSLIVLLYVLDNDTNTVVRISVFVGLGIEIWKIPKVVNVKVDWENKLFGIIPRVWTEDKGTYVTSSTKQYDELAFKYLSWLLFPLLGAYAIYSLLYQEHKGWYSWVLSMLYGYLLTFGFIMMTPQLFINYKMKSIAHLPWRMLTYKALNTFIDDIFAFVIKMPTMYRIGCFRDDIVFFIFLYQKYIYPIDPRRVNEFGTTGEDHGAAEPSLPIGGADAASDAAAAKSVDEKKND